MTRLTVDAAFLARLEPEVRQLDRNVRRDLAALNLFEHSEVMIANRGRFRPIGDLLTQLGEDAAHAGFRELARGFERSLERFARHEALDRPLEEAALAELAREPLAARRFQEETACKSHGEIV